MDFVLREAAKEDAGYILRLEEACMRGYAEALWGQWRPSDTPKTLELQGHRIVEHSGGPVGCVATKVHPDHLFVDKLYIDPAFQNRGIGARVLRRVVREAENRGLPTRLSVLTTNPARRFYEREGFVVEAETPERRRMVRQIAAGG